MYVNINARNCSQIDSGEDPRHFSRIRIWLSLKNRFRAKITRHRKKLQITNIKFVFINGHENVSSKLEFVDSGLTILSEMKITLYIRCYSSKSARPKIIGSNKIWIPLPPLDYNRQFFVLKL